jgi:hypothetical protein
LNQLQPPWSTASAWRRVNDHLARLIADRGPGLEAARLAARAATEALADLFPFLDELVCQANPLCRENCCQVARVYFQLDDLVYLHLSGQTLPPAQTRASPDQACRYLRATGCALPRAVRPWHCTWFICDVQLEVLGRMPTRRQRVFSALFEEVMAQRRRMIEVFRDVAGQTAPDLNRPPG